MHVCMYVSVCVCIYIYIYYTLVSASGDPLRSYRENPKQWFPLHVYYLRIRDSEFCILVLSAIWSRSMELKRVSVTSGSAGLTLPKYRGY